MQTTVSTQEMINDRFLPLQSLQRASRIELIKSLYIQGWTTQIPLTSTHRCSISQQHISQVHTCRPKHSDQHKLSVCWSCLNRSRGTSLRGIFFRSCSASLIAKPQKAFQTNAASYQIWLAVYCVPWTRLVSCGWSACILFSFFT